MNSKKENEAIVEKYIQTREYIYPEHGKKIRWAHLKREELKKFNPLQSLQGVSSFSMLTVKCVEFPKCKHTVDGYYPKGETPATDYSNFVIPPLCGEHLLEAAEALDQLLVQALLSLDQKIMTQKVVTHGPYAEYPLPQDPWWSNRYWARKSPGKAKNRME